MNQIYGGVSCGNIDRSRLVQICTRAGKEAFMFPTANNANPNTKSPIVTEVVNRSQQWTNPFAYNGI